ncbi:hypothetical protein GE061_001784 [Apolygus lucorum]|uniref:Hyaluronidase n=1 Tax=Apolygus lucorum TaxID=248454 RepID=A0A8S9X3C4_APOLU|nr:hypothetical protein GE061_001784 [Apolygus lucorum]
MQKFWTKDNPLYSSIVFIVCLLSGRPDCNNRNDEVTSSSENSNETLVMPDYDVYWNVPTFQCHKYGLNFSSISTIWGCKQNFQDEFKGEQISIFYDPGEFPALLEAPPAGTVPRNGGVPQEGSLDVHLDHFEKHVESLLPENFNGKFTPTSYIQFVMGRCCRRPVAVLKLEEVGGGQVGDPKGEQTSIGGPQSRQAYALIHLRVTQGMR